MKNTTFYKLMTLAAFSLLFGRFLFIGDGLSWLYGAIRPIIFVGVILYMLTPLVQYLDSHLKLSHTLCVVIAFIVFLLILSVFVGMILPSMIRSTRQLIVRMPQNKEQFMVLIDSIPFISLFVDTSSLSGLLYALGSWLTTVSQEAISYGNEILDSFVQFIGTVSILLLSFIMAFYVLKDHQGASSYIREVFEAYLPEKVTHTAFKLLKTLDTSVQKFLIGKLLTCLALGIIVTLSIWLFNFIGLWGLYIPYAPLIGFIIGATNIIPYIGPLIGTIPCLLLASLSGLWEAVVLLIIILVAQQIDNILISPKILGDSVGLKPFWIVFSVTVGGAMFGVLGMVLSIPVTSVLLMIIDEKVQSNRKKTTDSSEPQKL